MSNSLHKEKKCGPESSGPLLSLVCLLGRIPHQVVSQSKTGNPKPPVLLFPNPYSLLYYFTLTVGVTDIPGLSA
jgi:hypothetical protein